MQWDFPNISIPDCVPEYFREQSEREGREAQLNFERLEHDKANQKKIKKAYEDGLPVLDYGGYDACLHCENADHDTQTGFEDDICCVICHHPDCEEHKKHKN